MTSSELSLKSCDFLKMTSTAIVDEDFINQIETLYNSAFSEDLKRIFSLCGEVIFLEDEAHDFLRVLSRKEIISASQDLEIDFVDLMLIPLIDTGDNDFIAYDLGENHWCMFNIVDEIKFKENQSLSEYLSV